MLRFTLATLEGTLSKGAVAEGTIEEAPNPPRNALKLYR
jgi:hypothetical protein